MFRVALDRHHVDRLRLVRVNVNHKSEIRRQIAADFLPGIAGIIAAHHVPMLLHEEHTRALGMHRNVMNAVADLGVRIRNILRSQPAVDRLPGFAAIIGAECPGSRDSDEDSLQGHWDRE